MRIFFQLASLFAAVTFSGFAQENRSPAPVPSSNPAGWSMVYLPEIDWSEPEIKQAIDLLNDLKPSLVVSFSPCPFSEQIRNLPSKPKVLDNKQRTQDGEKCGVPINPLSAYVDTSTLHSIGKTNNQSPHLVWISSTLSKNLYHGSRSNEDERGSLTKFQVREQISKRQGEVVFLIDPELSLPNEKDWLLPRNNVKYEQAPSAMTGFACIRPDTLMKEIPAIDGIVARVPVLHWIHPGPDGMEWNILPIDKGPAIQHSNYRQTEEKHRTVTPKVKWLRAPVVSSAVPPWMDHYVNNNPALKTGNTIQRGFMTRIFGWKEYDFSRDPFKLLDADHHPIPDQKLQLPELPRGAVRSPSNLFSITVGQMGEQGWYPVDGDDGFNTYLDDRRVNKSHLIFFSGLYSPWPTAATWFTDRYVITSGIGAPVDDWTDENAYISSTEPPMSLYLFDLQTGKSFITASHAPPKTRHASPTERIFFPNELSYEEQARWRFLWSQVEAAYRIKPLDSPISIDVATSTAKLPVKPDLKWKDLGIWPPPETWQLVSEKKIDYAAHTENKIQDGGHPLLTYTENPPGQRLYRLAISSFQDAHFNDEYALKNIAAHADLFTTGDLHMRQIKTVERLGENKECLLLAGTFAKPNTENGNWLLLLDLSKHRAWSSHW